MEELFATQTLDDNFDIQCINDYQSLFNDSMFEGIEPFFDPSWNEPYIWEGVTPVMTQAEIDAILTEATLPSDMVAQSALEAGRFFGLPDPNAITPADQTCMMNWMKDSFFDDVIGFNQQQLIDMGITTKEAVDLVMSHEAAHRIFQNYDFSGVNDGAWEHELAADFMAGVRAGIDGINTDQFTDSLNGPGASTHPSGNLRADFIDSGKEFVEQWRLGHNGESPSFEECKDHLESCLRDSRFDIIATRTSLDGLGVEGMYGDSFFDIALNKANEFFTKVTS